MDWQEFNKETNGLSNDYNLQCKLVVLVINIYIYIYLYLYIYMYIYI